MSQEKKLEMHPVVVIGGGCAGLAAAVELAERSFPVVVIEARPALGGRAQSRFDPELGTWIDNGPHVMMGCYHETLAFLRRIGATDQLLYQPRLHVELVDQSGHTVTLSAPDWPAPAHIAAALLRFRALSLRERLLALSAGLRWMRWHRIGNPWLRFATVADLLDLTRQPAHTRRYLWHPIVIATLNERPERAAAEPFVEVVRRAFFGTKDDSKFIFPRVGLSDLYVEQAIRFLSQRGVQVLTRAVAGELVAREDRVVAVRLRDGRNLPASSVICAVPPNVAGPLLGTPEWSWTFSPSPIVSVHLRYKNKITLPGFVGMLGTHAQWLFHRRSLLAGSHPGSAGDGGEVVSVVLSAAHEEVEWENERIVETVTRELSSLWANLRDVPVLAARVVKEKHATVSLTPVAHRLRPASTTRYPNVFLAGDWVATGLPATIEGAILSGKIAAREVQRTLLHGTGAKP